MRILPSTLIPEGSQALVTYTDGTRKVIVGPQRIGWFGIESTSFLHREILLQDEKALLIDETGKERELSGPSEVFLRPAEKLIRFEKIELQPHEAVVVHNARTGKQKIYVGSDKFRKDVEDARLTVASQFYLNPQQEKLHTFKWTGSRGDSERKMPGVLHIDKLRLQETQTYFSFPARTKDGVESEMSLMMFLDYTSIINLLENDDPMGVMYNTVMAELIKDIGEKSFEEFRTSFAEIIEKAKVFQPNEISAAYTKLGLKIQRVVLKGWVPQDPSVSRLMAQEATITASQAVQAAEHAKNLKAIGNEKVELTAQAQNDAIRKGRATAEGRNQAARLMALKTGLKDLDGETVNTLLKLDQAGKAASGGLTLTTEAMGMAN